MNNDLKNKVYEYKVELRKKRFKNRLEKMRRRFNT